MVLKNWQEVEKNIKASGVYENDHVEKMVMGNCHFCGREVNSDFWCFGCKEFICDTCDDVDSRQYPCGKHDIQAHRHPVIQKALG